jgi:hypothetical protein
MKVVGCFFLRLPLYNKVVHAADALAGSVAEAVNAAAGVDFGADIVSVDLFNDGNDVDVVDVADVAFDVAVVRATVATSDSIVEVVNAAAVDGFGDAIVSDLVDDVNVVDIDVVAVADGAFDVAKVDAIVAASDAVADSIAEAVYAAAVDGFGANVVSFDLVNDGNDVDAVMLLLLKLLFLLFILLLIVLLRL